MISPGALVVAVALSVAVIAVARLLVVRGVRSGRIGPVGGSLVYLAALGSVPWILILTGAVRFEPVFAAVSPVGLRRDPK
jgi:hypothetical protein